MKGQIADLVAKAEAGARAREAAAAAARYSRDTPSHEPGPRPTPLGESATSARCLNYTYAQIGKPYCYAGAGPDCFDCSGLAMMAWGQVGVSMPHHSYAGGNLPSVSMDQLQPVT